jgi:hypothetical protein
MLRQAQGGDEMNRRDVVQGLMLAAAAGTILESSAPALALPRESARKGLHLVVFDTRFSAARQFAGGLARDSWISRGISGDVTPLWHELLDRQWSQDSVAIYGMTTPHSFYCLEQLVADRFWRPTSQVPAGPLVRWALQPARIAS